MHSCAAAGVGLREIEDHLDRRTLKVRNRQWAEDLHLLTLLTFYFRFNCLSHILISNNNASHYELQMSKELICNNAQRSINFSS